MKKLTENKKEVLALIAGGLCLILGLVAAYFAPQALAFGKTTYSGGLLGLGVFLLLYVLAKPFYAEAVAAAKKIIKWKTGKQ